MKKYTLFLVSGLLLFLAGVALFNWYVNPLAIFSAPPIEGINTYKPELRERISKVYIVNHRKPELIILGSSRALAVPEDYPGFSGLRSYNLALSSGSGYEQWRMFQHANAIAALKRVIIGLDEGFGGGTQINFSEDRLAVHPDGTLNLRRFSQYLKDVSVALLSVDAIRASVGTLQKQHNLDKEQWHRQQMKERVYRAGGHHSMFRGAESGYLSGNRNTRGCQLEAKPPAPVILPDYPYFRNMIDTAYRQGIHFDIYFSPVHARLYEVFCQKGWWENVENFKRSVVHIVEEGARRHDRPAFPVWDFGGYNTITTENVPPPGDRSTLMKWYWESSHYTSATARLVLDRMLNRPNPELPEDFGVQLNSGNIETHLADIRRQRTNYVRTHAGDVEEIRVLARRLLQPR